MDFIAYVLIPFLIGAALSVAVRRYVLRRRRLAQRRSSFNLSDDVARNWSRRLYDAHRDESIFTRPTSMRGAITITTTPGSGLGLSSLVSSSSSSCSAGGGE